MIRKIVILTVCIFIVTLTSAQQRKTIDRTKHVVSQSIHQKSNNVARQKKTFGSKSAKQNTFYFSISSRNIKFPEDGGTKKLQVSASNSWSIIKNTTSWGHLTRSGNTLTLKVDANNSIKPRNDYFVLLSGRKKIRVNIRQSRANISVSCNELVFDANGGIKTISISALNHWEIGTRTLGWGHLTTMPNGVFIKVDPNNDTNIRKDFFTIRSGKTEKVIHISQAGSPIKANINRININNYVDVDGMKGLGINVTFNVNGMKNHNVKVICYFYDIVGNALLNTNNSYGTYGIPSYVAASRSITPCNENSFYTDLEIRIPYDELHLTGTLARYLKVNVVILDDHNGTLKEITRKEGISFYCNPSCTYLTIDGKTSGKKVNFNNWGGKEYLFVKTNARSYKIKGLPKWCHIENKSSSGFTLVCKSNINKRPRLDWFKIKTKDHEVKICVEQNSL